MKTCVSSYSFSKLMKKGELNQLTAMKKAKELGFDAMEFSGMLPHDGSTPIEYAKMLRREADAMDFPIVSFVVPADLASAWDSRSRVFSSLYSICSDSRRICSESLP